MVLRFSEFIENKIKEAKPGTDISRLNELLDLAREFEKDTWHEVFQSSQHKGGGRLIAIVGGPEGLYQVFLNEASDGNKVIYFNIMKGTTENAHD